MRQPADLRAGLPHQTQVRDYLGHLLREVRLVRRLLYLIDQYDRHRSPQREVPGV
jgi:hypothetical protein